MALSHLKTVAEKGRCVKAAPKFWKVKAIFLLKLFHFDLDCRIIPLVSTTEN
jgi:hypothetical protein